ncbi:MAG: IS200/IS605 family transposase [Anaerolineae bacterium]|nr:IS200/IS605 family transposase [Anaerolineae bacterium]
MPYSNLFYHFVWTTKQRIPFITQDNRVEIYRAIRKKIEAMDGMVLALNGMEEHVHLFVSIPPKLAPATCIGQVKGASSFAAARLVTGGEPFDWQDEYGVLTVSESHIPHILDYIDKQQQHHSAGTLDPCLEFGQP